MIWAIVPVKPLRRGKSRLAGTLSEDERTDLNRELLKHTIEILASLKEITQVLVVSRDTAALAIAREHGARTLREDGSPKLNTALTRATAVAIARSASGVLVIPADLPLLDPKDLVTLIEKSKPTPSVVIAPDRRGNGTNALFVSPPNLIPFSFGDDSFENHCANAKEAGARLVIVKLPSLALDLDLPEDLALLDGLEGMKSG
jgi:2-phospho-L-lactate guanylyltransferase